MNAMVKDDAPPGGLTNEEANFVYNVEILGMPAPLAARQAGMPITRAVKPHIVQARQVLKDELRRTVGISKEDCAYGMREAIDRARLLAEPMTEIVGWRELAKLMGYDAPQQVNINMQATVEVVRGNLRQIPEDELVRMLPDADGIIDADFDEIPTGS